MKSHVITRWMLVFLFSFHVVFAASIFADAVLCVGDDGHVAVELSCLCGTQENPGNAGSILNPAFSSCIDVPLIVTPAAIEAVPSQSAADQDQPSPPTSEASSAKAATTSVLSPLPESYRDDSPPVQKRILRI